MSDKNCLQNGRLNFSIDFSAMNYTEKDISIIGDKFIKVHEEMRKIENGAIKNPDENRKVTHFTDRKEYIDSLLFNEVETFVRAINSGKIRGSTGEKFEYTIINGIGGSALGPQLMQFAINGPYWNELDAKKRHDYLKIFPMAESIGGRTSETSIVGHLPAALVGIDFRSFLKGACEMDEWTRESDYRKNPAYMLATMWYLAGNGKGNKNMVIVPYSDRLVLMSRYLQQLIMESVGKEKDLDGKNVYQGLNVFGNKGGTDAHAYIQQLHDGRNDFFATFIEVLKDAAVFPVNEKTTMGDYLHGFHAGLVNALKAKKRQLIQIQVKEISPYMLGQLIALYERTVAAYAELIHINAFHQPGVQAYKLASNDIIRLTEEIQSGLASIAPFKGIASSLCKRINMEDKENEAAGILAKFAENNGIRNFNSFTISRTYDENIADWIYAINRK